MSTLSLSNISQAYGDFDVFLGISATVPNDGKVGLVGPNGIGKTTLLRIIAGVETPSSGEVRTSGDTRIGYLRQEAMQAFAERDNTVHGEMLTVFRHVREQEAALREMEAQMASGGATDEMLARYSHAQQTFEAGGGYDYEVRIGQTLDGLGFKRDDWRTPLSHLSGGQKTRALLARLLLERPDLLILDEPTNHLDIAAVEWLEGTLRTWEGALLIVSHDRYFLDVAVNRIWELSRAGVEEYRGNYSHYVTQRQERWDRRLAEFEAIQQKFLKELDYIKRNIARDATKNQAVGRMKRLVREVRVVAAGGLHLLNSKNWGQVMDEVDIASSRWSVMELESAIKALEPPLQRRHNLHVRLETRRQSGKIVLRTSELEIGYPGASLFSTEPIELHRGECAALIGPNGAGKTTFLRTLLEQIEPLDGKVDFGVGLKLGYFAQAHEGLNPENTVLDELLDHKHMLLGEARSHLAPYLFRGEDVFKSVGSLSGGERGRLALAILALEGANFLLLDEPTNHLDIQAQEVLQAVLEAFDGTILMVSHDRYLIDRLATQIWAVDNQGRDGKLHVHHGAYTDYVLAREQSAESSRTLRQQAREIERQTREAAQQTNGAGNNGQPARSKNEERRHQKKVDAAEAQVHALEQRLTQLEAEIAAASEAQQVDKIQRLSQQYADVQAQLEASMEAWVLVAEG